MTLVIAIAAVIVSALTMIIVALQVAEARKANALPATINLFREYRSAEMEKARWLLANYPHHGEGLTLGMAVTDNPTGPNPRVRSCRAYC